MKAINNKSYKCIIHHINRKSEKRQSLFLSTAPNRYRAFRHLFEICGSEMTLVFLTTMHMIVRLQLSKIYPRTSFYVRFYEAFRYKWWI